MTQPLGTLHLVREKGLSYPPGQRGENGRHKHHRNQEGAFERMSAYPGSSSKMQIWLGNQATQMPFENKHTSMPQAKVFCHSVSKCEWLRQTQAETAVTRDPHIFNIGNRAEVLICKMFHVGIKTWNIGGAIITKQSIGPVFHMNSGELV